MSFSPRGVNATIEGVVRAPSRLATTLGFPPSMTAMQQFVVPRSMPMTLPIAGLLAQGWRRGVTLHADADESSSQDAVVEEIAALEDRRHRVGSASRGGVGGHRLVHLGVERRADRVHRVKPLARELLEELALDEPD